MLMLVNVWNKMQDAVFKKQCERLELERMEWSHRILSEVAHNRTKGDEPVSMEYLESIAQIRFALSVVAELLFKQSRVSRGCHTHTADLLIQAAKDCCTNDNINDKDSGPAVYLVKLLVRQYGMSFITTLTTDPTSMKWIVPPHLRGSAKASVTIIPPVQDMKCCTWNFRVRKPWTASSFTINCMLI